MFIKGQEVVSRRTGLPYTVLCYDEPTLDGAEVVVLHSSRNPGNPFPALAEEYKEF